MANLDADRNTRQEDGLFGTAKIKGGVKAYQGGLALLDADGYYNPAAAVKCAGVIADPTSDMSYDNRTGSDDDAGMVVRFFRKGVYDQDLDSTDPPTDADRGLPLFAVDDHTVSLCPMSAAGVIRPYVGKLARVEGKAWVDLDPGNAPAPAELGAQRVAKLQTVAAGDDLFFNQYQDAYPVKGDGGAVTLTADFPDGYNGQRLTIRGTHANTVTLSGSVSNLKLAGGQSAVLGVNCNLTVEFDGTDWNEVGRSLNS